MSISKDTIETVRERAKIEDIIGRYVPSLKRRGSNFIGLCPFHKEKTPSFTVSPDKQIFHCFGCHAGGNVFSFISKIERLTFPESVVFVGRLVGIEVKDERESGAEDALEEYLRMNNYAMKVFQSALKSDYGRVALDYLLQRGVTEESVETFKLGYSPESWEFLTGRLSKHNADLDKACEIGLISKKENPDRVRYYDRFRNRVIFPIFDRYGKVAGFGGRVIDGGEPKYLNSPDSVLYKKRQILYAFDVAKPEIASLKRAIVVEGYLDVIGCHQAGIRNVVAPLGTALTEEQVRLLARYAEEIILLFDSDSAGVKASLRSLSVLKDVNVRVKVALLPEDDPFDFIQNKGLREFMVVVDSAMDPVDFKIARAMAENARKEKLEQLVALFDVVKEIEFDTERVETLKKVSTLMNIDFPVVSSDFAKYISRGVVPVQKKEEVKRNDFLYRSYSDLIVLICNYTDLLDKALLDFSESDIKDSVLRNIFQTIGRAYSETDTFSIDKVFDCFPSGVERDFLEKNLSVEFKIEDPMAAYTEIYINLKLYEIDKKIEYYADLIKRQDGNIMEYLTEIDIWRREREKLSSYIYNLNSSVKDDTVGF